MPSPFPGMDPYLEMNPIFQELHTQMIAEMQAILQPQLRPKYVARLERHLSEGSVWEDVAGTVSLERKEPDVTIVSRTSRQESVESTVVLAAPSVLTVEDLEPDELELRKQRRIVIYVQDRPRIAVTGIELLSPGNKQPGAVARDRYLEKRSSALHGGLHWVEIDLLRGGMRPPMPMPIADKTDYLGYVAQATRTGWNHLLYPWKLRDRLPKLPIPLLGVDQASVDLQLCFTAAYDRIAADDDVDYASEVIPAIRKEDVAWTDRLLRDAGLRKRRKGNSRK